ncbi:MAG: DUF5711 family protein [Lachnospiraceae bacterium]|nr:DUF5711 family protein [Lachnospiraceae bacterium]
MSRTIAFPDRRDTQAENNRINDKIRRRHRTRFYTILLLLGLVCALVLAYFIYENTKVYKSLEMTQSVTRQDVFQSNILPLGENLLTYSKDGANCMDSSGNLLWNMTFGMQNPMVSICRETAAFADYGASTIYVHTKDGNTAEIDTSMPIRKLTVSEKGIVAAVLEDTNLTWIYIYDMNSTVIAYFRITMEKSGYPVDVDISPSGELVCVSYYYLDSGEKRSSVAFYNFGEVGQNNIDNYVSGYNYENFVPYVEFMDNSTVFAASTGRISVYEGKQKPVSISETLITDEVLSVFNSESNIGVVYENVNSEKKYRLEIYNSKGALESKTEFDFDYSSVAFGKDWFIIYGNTDLYVATISGEKRFEGKYIKPMKLVIPSNVQSKYYVVTEGSFDTMELN